MAMIFGLRDHWASEVCLILISFLLGALRCSAMVFPSVPAEGYIIGEVRSSNGRNAIVESEQGRIDISFFPAAPVKESLVAVWYKEQSPAISWPGGIDHQRRAKRVRTPIRRAKDWTVLRQPERPIQPSLFSELEHGELLWAFASGQRGNIDPEVRQLMRTTGTSHLLAISGMHIGLVSALGYMLARILLSPFIFFGWEKMVLKVPLLVAMMIAVYYGDRVGWPPSAKRAVIMVVLLSFGKLWDIDISLWDLLGISALLILVREPAELHSLGFQLSFAAVIGILWITPIFQRVISKDRHPLFNKTILSMGVTMGAMLGTLPLCGWLFQKIPLISPVSNLIVSPLMGGVAVPMALLGSISSGWLAMLALCLGDAAIDISLYLLQLLEVPALTVAFSPWQSVATSAVIVAIRWRITVIVLLIPLAWKYESTPDEFEVHFLSMGQGDGALLRWPDGRDWLIDAGPFSFELLPYLRREGIWQLDKVVLSHPHPDHMNALFPVIEALPIDAFVTVRPPKKGEEKYQQLWAKITAKEIAIQFPETPQESGVIIHHPRDGWTTKKRTVNEQSLVVEVQYYAHRFLFTGDIEAEAEQHLQGKIGKIDVLKVPHHGSKSSSSPEWLAELKPQMSIISCGELNSYGHPHVNTLITLRESQILRTDEHGIISVVSDGELLTVHAQEVLSSSND